MLRAFGFSGRSLKLLIFVGIFATLFLFTQFDRDSRAIRLQVPKFPFTSRPASPASEIYSPEEAISISHANPHPIDDLLRQAQVDFDILLSKATKDVESAAAAYRSRRKRHPPPHFDRWVAYAHTKGAIVVEDFFDQIYHDLDPFWALSPKVIRTAVESWPHVISVRNGNATFRSDDMERAWMLEWTNLVSKIAKELPDVDIAINEMDESRILAPWETIDRYRRDAIFAMRALSRRVRPEVGSFSPMGPPVHTPGKFEYGLLHEGPLWSLARAACPPDSPGRAKSPDINYGKLPDLAQYAQYPISTYKGFVMNWTTAKDPCQHSELAELHGSFIEPISISSTANLFPIFGGSKLPMNNDILLPAAMYWSDDPFYSGGNNFISWSKKRASMIWRGTASGGRNKEHTWPRYQRHRFVAMLNGSNVHAEQLSTKQEAVSGDLAPATHAVILPDTDLYTVHAAKYGKLGGWISTWADGGFTHPNCWPREPEATPPTCRYIDPFFKWSKAMPMSEQYANKYLPDIDGNSFSGRYRGFLRSNSVPIKATIYSEWHDSRLVPWKHFVPMDNMYGDFYAIAEYFLGFDGAQFGLPEIKIPGRDAVGHMIGASGRDWAEKVLRKEDMEVYVYRLLLEYARICDERRSSMGWAADLKDDAGNETNEDENEDSSDESFHILPIDFPGPPDIKKLLQEEGKDWEEWDETYGNSRSASREGSDTPLDTGLSRAEDHLAAIDGIDYELPSADKPTSSRPAGLIPGLGGMYDDENPDAVADELLDDMIATGETAAN